MRPSTRIEHVQVLAAEHEDALSGDFQEVCSEVRDLNESPLLCGGGIGFPSPAYDPGAVHVEDGDEFGMAALRFLLDDIDAHREEAYFALGRLDHPVGDNRTEGYIGGSDEGFDVRWPR